uniref:Uncharacterized protein n=1 Tax=Oryza punctata TaxID=4537 RepID=A0A0E0LNR9_ORYPU
MRAGTGAHRRRRSGQRAEQSRDDGASTAAAAASAEWVGDRSAQAGSSEETGVESARREIELESRGR